MKTPLRDVTGIFSALVLILCAHGSQAGSTTWDQDPVSADWNNPVNWMPPIVPNGPADTATFAVSNTTDVSISANTIVNTISFAPGGTSFTITPSPGFILTLSGGGIINGSGAAQNFIAAPSGDAVNNAFRLIFSNGATAGSGTFFTMNGGTAVDRVPGWINFRGANAGSGTFTNNGATAISTFGPGATIFNQAATAGSGTFINNGGMVVGGTNSPNTGGFVFFDDSSTAANGSFTNNPATVSGAAGGLTEFFAASTAANGTFTNNAAMVRGAGSGITYFFTTSTGGTGTFTNNGASVSGANGGSTVFYEASTADNGIFTNDGATVSGGGAGVTKFFDRSTAGSATLVANPGSNGGAGGMIVFADDSTGGVSRVEVFGNGTLDISLRNAPHFRAAAMTVGSIEGDGRILLGANTLTVGNNNLNTVFSGVIHGAGGSLTKVGLGTLVLAGVNAYSGDTTIKQGVLQVDGSVSSNTFVKHGGTLAGIGTVQGEVTNSGGTVSPGNGAPGRLTITGNYTQSRNGALVIDIAGTSSGQVSLLDVLGSATLHGMLDPVLQNGFVPLVGDQFVFLEYGSFTGSLFMHDRNVDDAMEHWVISYEPGQAVLTVARGNVSVPDHASTLLLLALSSLALVVFRQALRHRNG